MPVQADPPKGKAKTPSETVELHPKPLRLTGFATWYGQPGEITAEVTPFNPAGMNAAMFQKGIALGDSVDVQLASDPTKTVDVIVNDTGPFARGSDGKALRPFQPDASVIIDLTPAAFLSLAPLSVGKIPVVVTVIKK